MPKAISRRIGLTSVVAYALAAAAGLAAGHAGAACTNTVTASVVAIDQPLMFNRLGAQNVNGMMYALRRDVIDKTSGRTEAGGGTLTPGNVQLRLDKRPARWSCG